MIILIILAAISISALTKGNFIGLATRTAENYSKAQEYEGQIMEDFVKRLEGVYRNIQSGGYFEKAGTIDGKETGDSLNPTIPAGFKPVDDGASWGDGTKAPAADEVNKGLVIEDKEGNQFVWVPCSTTGENGVTKYALHKYEGENTSDANARKEDNKGWKTWAYRAYSDWKDPAVDTEIPEYEGEQGYGTTSVNTYGGFYVARYEAGIPETADFYPDAANSYQYKKDGRDIGTIAPVSKKNAASWSWISQENAKNAAEKMIPGKSHLIDGVAWDTIVEWIGEKEKTVTDSKDVGNYYTSEGKIPRGTMYITHTNGSSWTTGNNYQKADSDIDQPKGTGTNYYEVYTGSLDNTKLKNIYDMAGNMWEWTTETGKHDLDNGTTYAIIRGGGFYDHDIYYLCYRSGYNNATLQDCNLGFRVVLYL